MVVPTVFFGRRIVFVCTLVFMRHIVWAQLAIQIGISLGNALFLQAFKPLKPIGANHIETMNECTIMLLSYLLMCFTDYVPEAETRSELGVSYMSVSLGASGIHLIILVVTNIKYVKLYIRIKYY